MTRSSVALAAAALLLGLAPAAPVPVDADGSQLYFPSRVGNDATSPI